METPLVGILIVNYNRRDDTVHCVASVYQSNYPCYEVVVVDNHSTDDSVEALTARYPGLTVLINDKNEGFTGGNNWGIRYLLERSADYILLLNNDAIIAPDTITMLVNHAVLHPEAGFLGAKVYTLENPQTLLTVGGYLARNLAPTLRGLGEIDSGQYDSVCEVEYVSGNAMLVSRAVIESVGMLDPDYFAYFEDIDWCFRGRQKGFKSLFVPAATAWHPDTRKRDENSALVTYYIERNCLLFAKKHALGSRVLFQILYIYTRRLLSWSLRPKWKHKKSQRDALFSAMKDFFLNKAGPIDSQRLRYLH